MKSLESGESVPESDYRRIIGGAMHDRIKTVHHKKVKHHTSHHMSAGGAGIAGAHHAPHMVKGMGKSGGAMRLSKHLQ